MYTRMLLLLLIACGVYNSKLDRHMRFRYHQSNIRQPLPASGYCRARGNQIFEYSSDNETVLGSVLGSNRKLGGTAEHFIDGRKKRICRKRFEF